MDNTMRAQQEVPTIECPPGKTFVPQARESSSSGFTHHPALDVTHNNFGEQQILFMITQHVKACAVYTQS